MSVQFLVVLVMFRHMCYICNVTWKIFVGTRMPAYKTVVFVADPDFRHRCFQDCRFAMVCVQYRIIVTIILKMIIIRYTCIIPVITKRIAASRQRTHPRFVIGFKCVHPCFTDVRFLAEFILVDGCYYFLCCPVEFFQTCIDILFQPFN